MNDQMKSKKVVNLEWFEVKKVLTKNGNRSALPRPSAPPVTSTGFWRLPGCHGNDNSHYRNEDISP